MNFLDNPTFWIFVIGLGATGVVTVHRVNTLAEQQREDRKSIHRLIRWKQRVNTVMSANDMPIPADDDD